MRSRVKLTWFQALKYVISSGDFSILPMVCPSELWYHFFKKGQFSDKTINWYPQVTESSTNSLRADWTKRNCGELTNGFKTTPWQWCTVKCLLLFDQNSTTTCQAAVVGDCGVKIFSTVEIRSLYKYRQFYCMIFFLLIFTVLGLPRLLCTAVSWGNIWG